MTGECWYIRITDAVCLHKLRQHSRRGKWAVTASPRSDVCMLSTGLSVAQRRLWRLLQTRRTERFLFFCIWHCLHVLVQEFRTSDWFALNVSDWTVAISREMRVHESKYSKYFVVPLFHNCYISVCVNNFIKCLKHEGWLRIIFVSCFAPETDVAAQEDGLTSGRRRWLPYTCCKIMFKKHLLWINFWKIIVA